MNVVHVGFPKTATTFLQWEVFPHVKDYHFIDYHQCHETMMDLIYLDELDYEEAAVKSQLAKYLSEKNNLASYEALVGAPFTFKGLGRSNTPQRLKNLGFDRVIITIRDQPEALDSLYRQYVVQGGVMRFRDFINLDQKWNRYLSAFNLDYLKYDRLIARYQAVFGVENVLVLRQEHLKDNQIEFIQQISSFLETEIELPKKSRKANQSLSNFSIGVLRVFNHFTFNSQRPNQLLWNKISSKNIWKVFVVILEPYLLRWFFKKHSYVRGEIRAFVEDYYEESNQVLKNLIKNKKIG